MLDNINFVLLNTSHPGNIGAVARAIKVMGFKRLSLVNPQSYPSPEATARASGADDVLSKALCFHSVVDSISKSHLVFGSSARNRGFDIPVINVREAASLIASESIEHRVSVLFGTERFGMTNQELEQCHYLVKIPTSHEYSSLNLSAAVQIIAYEVRMAIADVSKEHQESVTEYATVEKMESFYQHLFSVLQSTQYLTSDRAASLQCKLRIIFNRLRAEKHELDMLRGILSSIEKKIVVQKTDCA